MLNQQLYNTFFLSSLSLSFSFPQHSFIERVRKSEDGQEFEIISAVIKNCKKIVEGRGFSLFSDEADEGIVRHREREREREKLTQKNFLLFYFRTFLTKFQFFLSIILFLPPSLFLSFLSLRWMNQMMMSKSRKILTII